MRESKLKWWTLCGLFAALTSIMSQLAIPLEPVPINLATLAVFLAGGLLGARYGAVSQGVYLLMGLVGIPVFSLWRSGLGMLVGPTGGYLMGYGFAAAFVGLVAERFHRSVPALALGMAGGAVIYYTMGTAWYVVSTGVGVAQAVAVCVLPFLGGDLLKIILAVVLVRRLRGVLEQMLAGSGT